MNPDDKLKQMEDIYKKYSKDNPGMSIEYSYKTKGNPDDIFSGSDFEYDDGVEGVDFEYDKHGNKWAIVKPENHPARQQEYRPDGGKKK